MPEEELTIDDHELLDMGAKIDIILQGFRYGVLFQETDLIKKCIIDLQDCIDIMRELVEDVDEQEYTV